MNRQRDNLFLVLAAAIGLVAVHELAPRGLYSFDGHGRLLFDCVEGLIWLLFLTHTFLAAIMWMQRRKWNRADAAAFLFISAKALFWIDLALTTTQKKGESLTIVYLFCVIFLTTINLDAQLVRRYLWAKKDAATDRRQGDALGTAARARFDEHDKPPG
jgi:hypothetical protein